MWEKYLLQPKHKLSQYFSVLQTSGLFYLSIYVFDYIKSWKKKNK